MKISEESARHLDTAILLTLHSTMFLLIHPISYNRNAVKTLVCRAMELGYYEGVNLSLAYCDDCGHEELEMDVCPVCGSTNLTKIDRMNGYLSYSRVHGDTRLNAAKMAEIAERKSM